MAQAYLAILGLFQPSIAQLVEHLTVDQVVPGSIPGGRSFSRSSARQPFKKAKRKTVAETRDRTGDLQIFSLTLSQLSYRGR